MSSVSGCKRVAMGYSDITFHGEFEIEQYYNLCSDSTKYATASVIDDMWNSCKIMQSRTVASVSTEF